MKRNLLLFILLFAIFPQLFATHQRAGEITFKHISGLTYEVKIVTYTYTPSPADRPELDIHWGDGSYSTLIRTEKINYPNQISRNVYTYDPSQGAYEARHTYSSPGTYTMWLEDPNRNAGIQNIPNSVNVPLYIETTLVINPFLGYNSSPTLLAPPIDNGCVGQKYVHNAGAFDIDGDSLSYRFVICKGAGGLPIPGYSLPPATDSITINPITGDVIWVSPTKQGEFNIAFLIEEWRNGIKISSLTRDMQITIIACTNTPPIIESIDDTCVEANTTLSFLVKAYDYDYSDIDTIINGSDTIFDTIFDIVRLSASGGPFEVPLSPATISPDPAIGEKEVYTIFTWNTKCEHVRNQYYYGIFRAEDNSSPVPLVDLKTIGIKVVSPPPENLLAEPLGNSIQLSWNTIVCGNAANYKIYRRNGYYGFIPGPCETGVPDYTGYRLIGSTNSINDTSFVDDNNGAGLVPGVEYCYIVTGYFSNGAESYASVEACAFLKKDLPIITNVSNDEFDLNSGNVYVAWSKPTELDTLQYPGPYYYRLKRGIGLNGAANNEIAVFSGLNDTIFTDNTININASDSAVNYEVELESTTIGYIGKSHKASSIELSLSPYDKSLLLSWKINIPWNNTNFIIYRKEPGSSTYDSVGFTNKNVYRDKGLKNLETYCYYIKSIGSYGTPGFIDPIINYSPIRCGIPIDNIPPCPPVLEISTNCDDITNLLSWTNPNHYKADTCNHDTKKYYIYAATAGNSNLLLIDSVLSADDTTYLHENLTSVVGCYAVTAIDTVGNESQYSNIVCIGTNACPLYEIPNVFTPNGDGYNDYLTPFPESLASIESIDLKIFNRWGKVVYETNDPMINWDGKNFRNGIECAAGVYFYVCDVHEKTLTGTEKR
ncbi:gliding motility-associated C-terminal domain-containing protein, partial [Bacteroidota bacterium]